MSGALGILPQQTGVESNFWEKGLESLQEHENKQLEPQLG